MSGNNVNNLIRQYFEICSNENQQKSDLQTTKKKEMIENSSLVGMQPAKHWSNACCVRNPVAGALKQSMVPGPGRACADVRPFTHMLCSVQNKTNKK